MARKKRKMNSKTEKLPKQFSKEWYLSYSDNDRKLFESLLFILLPVLVLFIYTLTKDPADSGYYKMHSALFLCCIIIALLFVIRKSEIISIVKSPWLTFSKNKNVSLSELIDVLFFLCGVIVIVSIVFVIDLDFMSSYGIRIGGVVAFGLAKTLKTIFSKQKTT